MQIRTQSPLKPISSAAACGFLKLVLAGFLISSFCQTLIAQDTNQSPSIAQLRDTYDSSVEKLRSTLKKLRRTEALFLFSDSEDSHQHKEDWDQLASDADTTFAEIRGNAFALFLAEDEPDEDLVLAVRNLAVGSVTLGQLGLSQQIYQKLVELDPQDGALAEELVRVEIFNNKFDEAIKFKSSQPKKIEKYNQKEKFLFRHIDELKTNFEREMKLREKDKTANLPRVEMKVKDKGIVILELFEDEAPETVANFISLTEDGFYDGMIFHNVTNSFLAQSGTMMSAREVKRVRYSIYDECKKPERRHHFRGSISTWPLSEQPNSGGAEFSVFRMPGPYFTQTNHTVFGRVIQGMDIIDEIENTIEIDQEDGSETRIPDVVFDKIESMKVIRKRDHEYKPNPVK